MNKVLKKLRRPSLLFKTLGRRGFFNWMSDKKYLEVSYRISMRKKLNLDNPETFTEKLQWLKLYDRKPEYTLMVDKFEAKEYVRRTIGDGYIIPTLGIWDEFDDIDFGKLPSQFVLKCTHDSGGLVICRDKSKFNISRAKRIIQRCMRNNYYWGSREWPYKNVKPRIIAEKYMEDKNTGELRDYKFFAFNGVVKALFVASDRQKKDEETKFDFFDENYNHLPLTNGHPNSIELPPRPDNFEKMKAIASMLSKGIPHVRVDLYEVNGEIFFGELTFSHWSGMTPFNPEKWDYEFGKWIDLPRIE